MKSFRHETYTLVLHPPQDDTLFFSDFNTDQLFCDCHLKWLVKWIRDTNVNTQDTKCSHPASLSNTLVRDLTKENLHCSESLLLVKHINQ